MPAWARRTASVTALMLAGACSAAESSPEAAPPDPTALHYEFGRGLRLGESGFTLGGYVTGEYRRSDDEPDQIKSSHASVFVWWEGIERVKLFAEIDLLNAVGPAKDEPNNDYGKAPDRRRASLERLYGDYIFSDAISLRLGKFLTPVGRWNQVHAAPLVWTTSAPMVTETLFPRSVTGVSLGGNLPLWGRAVGYSVYASNGRQWRADQQEDPFAKVLGGRLVLPLGYDLQLGLSAANYQSWSRNGEPQQLRGVDFYWSRGGLEFSAEWMRTRGTAVAGAEIEPDPEDHGAVSPGDSYGLGARRATRGGYAQGVVPLVGKLFGVARVDWLHDPRTVTFVRQHLVGLAWRPNAGTTLKLEYVRPSQVSAQTTQGVVASVSVLF